LTTVCSIRESPLRLVTIVWAALMMPAVYWLELARQPSWRSRPVTAHGRRGRLWRLAIVIATSHSTVVVRRVPVNDRVHKQGCCDLYCEYSYL